MQPGFQHPQLRDAEWLADQYSTKTIAEIADAIGVSNTSVQRALTAHGIERRSRNARRPPIQHRLLADRDWLAAQYTHSTATELATRLGANLETVRRALRLHQIAPHTPSETQRLLRPPELNDPGWLRAQYATRSIASIAEDLCVPADVVRTAMVRLRIDRRPRSETQLLRRPPLLDDPEQLARALSTRSVAEIATELGVAIPTVQVAMRRHGAKSPWKFDRRTPLSPPPADVLAQAWGAEETIRGVARRFEVSVNTAAVWLARIGIFLSDVPRISKSDLRSAIKRGDSIDVIRRQHHVTARTVVVELYRHGLFEAHRRRHMNLTDAV